MSNAWEVTQDDVYNVMKAHGIPTDFLDEMVQEGSMEEVVDYQLDHDAIEREALRGDVMDEQVIYAYEEINRQLLQDGTLINE